MKFKGVDIKKVLVSTLLLAILTINHAFAEIKLESEDGTIEINGTLLKFENGVYSIDTIIGELEVSGDDVICSGEECPDLLQLDQTIRIVASPLIANTFSNELLGEYANSINATISQTKTGSGGGSVQVISDSEGRNLATIETKSRNASEAFDDLLSGETDLILTERLATNEEIDQFLLNDLGDLSSAARETIWALDGVVIIVSPENPVQSLTLQQVEQVLSGSVSNWSEVGGKDLPITIYLPSDTVELSEYFSAAVLDANFSTFADTADRSLLSNQISTKIVGEPGAIALVPSSMAGGSKPLILESACGLQSSANSFSIRSETYPLTRRLFAYTTNRRGASRLADLVELLKSPNGQRTAANSGFVDLSVESSNMNSFGQQLAYGLHSEEQSIELKNLSNFARQLQNAERLSTTFRFSSGSSQLDNKSRADIVRLTEMLQQSAYQGAEIVLAGFSDSIGTSTLNQVLSTRRAGQVKEAILAVDELQFEPDSITTVGFGSSFPAACNDSNVGRQINRRVDVWIR